MISDEEKYAIRIVNILSKIDINNDCDKKELVKLIQKVFIEYKDKIKNL